MDGEVVSYLRGYDEKVIPAKFADQEPARI
jgi:hypothetical protein